MATIDKQEDKDEQECIEYIEKAMSHVDIEFSRKPI